MNKLVIRHGLSEANNRDNFGKLAFANSEAPLMEKGKIQAQEARQLLASRYNVVARNTDAATSTLLRANETAQIAGFINIRQYSLLNEVNHGVELGELRQMLDTKVLPKAALHKAEQILANPPEETIWITHGLVIAGLCSVLGSSHERFIPSFCEIRELTI